MSKSNTVEATVASPVLLDPHSPEVIPTNKLVTDYLAEGYEFTDYRSRSNYDAIEEAKRLRKDGTLLTAKITLLGGWYGVITKKADPKEAKAHKASLPTVPISFEGRDWASTKEARTFAAKLIEACRNAEYEAAAAEQRARMQAAKEESAE